MSRARNIEIMVQEIVYQFVRWYLNGTLRQRTDEAGCCRHIHWEHNLAADYAR